MLMLGLNEVMDQFAMARRRALRFEVEGQRKRGRLMRTWKRQVEEDGMVCAWRMHFPYQSRLLALIRFPQG